jgi:hypothetical protein
VIADFEAWIKMGAPDPRGQHAAALPPPYDFDKARQHWSYRPVQDPAPPAVSDPLWNKTDIDRFIKAKLDESAWRQSRSRANERSSAALLSISSAFRLRLRM